MNDLRPGIVAKKLVAKNGKQNAVENVENMSNSQKGYKLKKKEIQTTKSIASNLSAMLRLH